MPDLGPWIQTGRAACDSHLEVPGIGRNRQGSGIRGFHGDQQARLRGYLQDALQGAVCPGGTDQASPGEGLALASGSYVRSRRPPKPPVTFSRREEETDRKETDQG